MKNKYRNKYLFIINRSTLYNNLTTFINLNILQNLVKSGKDVKVKLRKINRFCALLKCI